VVIAGGGIVGVSLARELRRQGASVLIVERGQPGREASYAAAGMLAWCDPMLPAALRPLAKASAGMYPEFARQVEDESGVRVDLRTQGTIAYFQQAAQAETTSYVFTESRPVAGYEVARLEPRLVYSGEVAYWTPEGSVDPRALITASIAAAKHRGVDMASGSPVAEVEVQGGRAVALKTAKTRYAAKAVVNCCGAWAGEVGPLPFPTRPIKGQMLSVVSGQHGLVNHVIRAPEVYIVPRSDGRILIGSTLEDAGFDKRVETKTIQNLHQAALGLIPDLGEARIQETWAGLRPATPDGMPILGATVLPDYFVATGHYRDGILLAPVTGLVLSQVLRGAPPDFDLSPFSPARFG